MLKLVSISKVKFKQFASHASILEHILAEFQQLLTYHHENRLFDVEDRLADCVTCINYFQEDSVEFYYPKSVQEFETINLLINRLFLKQEVKQMLLDSLSKSKVC